jgi:hypothetical protein
VTASHSQRHQDFFSTTTKSSPQAHNSMPRLAGNHLDLHADVQSINRQRRLEIREVDDRVRCSNEHERAVAVAATSAQHAVSRVVRASL